MPAGARPGFAVVGLGRFGLSLALELHRQGYEVRSLDALAPLYAHNDELVLTHQGRVFKGWDKAQELITGFVTTAQTCKLRVADLKIVIDSLQRHGGERLVGSALNTLVEVAKACGFHLMSLDLRQNADVHERTLHELFERAGTGVK